MKHATSTALDQLAALLAQLRTLAVLRERKTGIFYRASKPYLHFHEDPAGLFADVRFEGITFTRFAVNTVKERAAFFAAVKTNCGQ